MTTVASVAQKALELSPRERVALAGFLLEIDEGGGNPLADEAWEKEIRARLRAIDSGSVAGIPYRDVMREADELTGPRRSSSCRRPGASSWLP